MTSTPRVTLAQVAGSAGVSVTTASYILNGRSAEMRISPETEARVLKAVAELGYRPNRAARSLRTRRTATFGLISDFIASGHFSGQMLTGASAEARRRDHVLLIGETGGDPELEDLLIEEMLDRQVDGLLFATVAATRIRVNPRLLTVPTVLLNCTDPDSGLPSVLPDDRAGGATAASILLDAGIRDRIWVVGEDPFREVVAGPERLAGVVERLDADGLRLAGVIACDWSVPEAYAAVAAWLATGERASGLVCLNDRVAMGAYQALAEAGLRIPEDVSVVSFDGSDLAQWLRPAATSVALPFVELGRLAVQLLMEQPTRRGGIERVAMPVHSGGSVR